ncbi:MAG: hypothetical protein DCC75_02640, partial [Proteobacteria bacterium]
MKKALIVIILLAVLGSAAYVIINRQQPGGEDLFSSLTSKIGGSLGVTTGQAEFPQGSYLKNVGENVLLSASLNPRNFDHLLNKLAAFRDKLVQSSVGKKFNLEEMLNMVISTQVPVDPEGAMQEQGFALAKAIWGSLSDFSLALSSKTFALPDKIEVPMVLVAASMSDDKLLNKAATILDQKVLEGQNAVMVEGIKIEKVAGQERSYKFSVEEGPSSVVGSLQINPGQARLLVGTTDEKEFLASEGGAKPLAQSALWAKAGLGVLPTAALFVLADSSKLSGMVSKLFQSAAGELTDQEAKQGFDMMFSGWADADSFSFSMSFDKGFKLRQCAAMKPDSTTAKLYQAVIKDKEDLVATKKPGFERLIS